ncbi:MAG TPA: glycerol-3-phosphate responsive antiterminator [Clostridiales bacterium]|nr:glycerol-3-phosphate responsive antiterminator [Clostridiales bacterium]
MLKTAVESKAGVIFLLQADIFNLQQRVDTVVRAKKSVLIHLDFVDGLGRDNRAIDYIKEVIRPQGIISTRSSQIKYAREIGLFGIQRFFLLDSLSYETTVKTAHAAQPDMIEIMPGLMPGMIRRITAQLSVHVIAGGLVETKQEVMEILAAGALAVSTGKSELWEL